jgi:hypothetical protein
MRKISIDIAAWRGSASRRWLRPAKRSREAAIFVGYESANTRC